LHRRTPVRFVFAMPCVLISLLLSLRGLPLCRAA
jgi:hypothetical protein